MRKRRSRQGIERLVAGATTVTLNSGVLAPQRYVGRVAMRTGADFFRAPIDKAFRSFFSSDIVKHRFELFALTVRQP
jgi:hypothetical protein